MATILGPLNLTVSAVATFFRQIGDSISLSISHFFDNTISSTSHAFSHLLNTITTSISNVFARLVNYVSRFSNSVISVVNGIGNTTSKGLHLVGSFCLNTWSWIVHLVQTTGSCISATWNFIMAALYYTALAILGTLIFIAAIVALCYVVRIGFEIWRRMPPISKLHSTTRSAANETTPLMAEHESYQQYNQSNNRHHLPAQSVASAVDTLRRIEATSPVDIRQNVTDIGNDLPPPYGLPPPDSPEAEGPPPYTTHDPQVARADYGTASAARQLYDLLDR